MNSLPALSRSLIISRLQRISNLQQLAFGAICCERLLPNYTAFQQDTNWGNITPIRTALEFVWTYIKCPTLSTQPLQQLLNDCESVIPDADDFTSVYVTLAQDAGFSVCCLLDFILEEDPDKIAQIAIYATDSVDLYVQEILNLIPNDPYLEKKILEHPLMQRELRQQQQQQQDIELIQQTPIMDAAFLEQLRQSWNNGGKSNLDLP